MRTLALSILGVAALFLTACPHAYPRCSNDESCKEHGEVCVQGQCRECAVDANCKAGFTCQESRCVPKPECRSSSECGAGRNCEAGKCVAAPEPKAENGCSGGPCPAEEAVECPLSPVYFGFNSHELSSVVQDQLKRVAECARGARLKLTLEGHADERGTEEYNLQLSNRRAASVRRYLMTLGVSPSDLDAVGYGENRPAQPGHTEEAWQANRRVELQR